MLQISGNIIGNARPPTARGRADLDTVALAAVGRVAAGFGGKRSCDARNQTGPSLVHGGDAVSSGQVVGGGFVKGVDVRLRELSRGDALGEQDVKLLKGAVLGFGEAEEGPDEREQGGRSPDKSGVAAEIPGFGVHEIGLQDTGDDAHDVIGVASETYGLLSQASGAHLCWEGPSELSGTELKDEGP